jgi:hypothetical protein
MRRGGGPSAPRPRQVIVENDKTGFFYRQKQFAILISAVYNQNAIDMLFGRNAQKIGEMLSAGSYRRPVRPDKGGYFCAILTVMPACHIARARPLRPEI